jgi:hypothetical protein
MGIDQRRQETVMSRDNSAQDPLEFVRGMWSSMGFSLPGMVAPTIDLNDLDKRISDLKAVENWLKINLNMLQMTTQGLEVQRATLATLQSMTQHAAAARREHLATPTPAAQTEAEADPNSGENPYAAIAAMWPWNFMNAQQAPSHDERDPEADENGSADARDNNGRKADKKAAQNESARKADAGTTKAETAQPPRTNTPGARKTTDGKS